MLQMKEAKGRGALQLGGVGGGFEARVAGS